MTIRHSRRAAQLASTLVAAGLVLAVAPQAVASDDSTRIKLTDTQAQALADRMSPEVYGDVAADVPVADDATSAQAGSGASLDAVDPTTPVTFTSKSSIETVRGLGVTLDAGAGRYFSLSSMGNVQLHDADGTTLWERTNTSEYADWGIRPLRVWDKVLYPPNVLMGYNAVSPYSPTSDAGYASGDLTGDGIPDLVFSSTVGMNPGVGATIPGTTMKGGTVVTVLDGSTGKTAWSKVYAYASMVSVVDGTLLVADMPRVNQYAPATQTATLTGTRFTLAGGVLTPSSTWTYDTKDAGSVSWGAVADLGDGRVAVSWNQRKTATAKPKGHTLAVDVATGATGWQSSGNLYGRQLHLDDARGRVVALEQADTSDAVSYSVVSYDLANGERTVLDTRVNALATAMVVGDAAAAPGTEYVVSESTLASNLYVNASTVRVLSGADGHSVQWSSTTKRDADNYGDGPSTWHFDVAGGLLIASSQDDAGISVAENAGGSRYGTLTAFKPNGKVAWTKEGVTASPMFQQVFTSGGTDFVRVVDQGQNIRTYTAAKGKEKSLTPLKGDLNFAQGADLDGNGTQDVVAGGSSNGVWAWDGRSLLKGAPKELWHTTVPGEVHDIETGDVNGDGKPEIVVAAEGATVVIDGATGNVLTTIAGGTDSVFVRSVTVEDVNADGKDEIIVPTDALRVYNARGNVLWTYAAPEGSGDVVFSDAVVGDGQVYAQYASLDAFNLETSVQNGVALDGKTGAEKWAADPVAPASALDGKLHGALLRRAVFTSPNIPYADGHAVVYTWIASVDPSASNDLTTVSPQVVTEIRDGRTGELLHQAVHGGPWSHDGFFVGKQGDPLYRVSFGTFWGFGAEGADTSSSVVAPLRGAQYITGPGGRTLVAGGLEGGLGVWDPSLMTTGWQFQSSTGSVNVGGGRNYLAVDLDGDGSEEMISLGFDHVPNDRMAAEIGGRVLSPEGSTHQMVTFKLS